MKKTISIILLSITICFAFVGCGNEDAEVTTQMALIGNPWSDWDSLEEAESAVGFSFGIPETIADTYNATAFRTMNNEMIEVIYHDEDSEMRVRKQKGEGEDISGDYNEYDTCTEEDFDGGTITSYRSSESAKHIISYKGYSWSITVQNGYRKELDADVLDKIMEK